MKDLAHAQLLILFEVYGYFIKQFWSVYGRKMKYQARYTLSAIHRSSYNNNAEDDRAIMEAIYANKVLLSFFTRINFCEKFILNLKYAHLTFSRWIESA